MLAYCSQRRQNASMSIQITIRDVPNSVRDELAARAALQGKSMQEYLRAELERLAARPPVEKVLDRIRERKAMAGTRLSPEEILAHRDAARR
jgi:plasmid stability protein